MPRIRITPQALVNELHEFNRRLGTGLRTLQETRDVTLGACERDVVSRIDNVVLYRYRPRARSAGVAPILLVYALVNRPDMVDLQRDRSLVQSLLDCGLDIYLIDWGYPSGADRGLGLDDYICRYVDHCVDAVRTEANAEAINLLGVCQGGTFSVCYSALNPHKVRNLITTVTPIDFQTRDDMLSHLFRYVDVDALVAGHGNVGGDLLNAVFLSLKPFRLAQQKYVHLVDSLDDEAATAMFQRMEKWIFDSPALAARAFREFTGEFYQKNGLVRGTITLGGRGVRLSAIEMPVLNIYAENDHLVPPAASLALGDHVGTRDYEAIGFPGGHIGLYVSTRAHATLPAAIRDWLIQR